MQLIKKLLFNIILQLCYDNLILKNEKKSLLFTFKFITSNLLTVVFRHVYYVRISTNIKF